jgi:hypothetical protein
MTLPRRRDGSLPVFFLLVGGLVLLGALSAFAVETKVPESAGGFCWGLIRGDLYDRYCAVYHLQRRHLVDAMTLIGFSMIGIGSILAISRREIGLFPKPAPPGDARLRWRVVLAVFAPTLWIALIILVGIPWGAFTEEPGGLPQGWFLLGPSFEVLLVCWPPSRRGVTRQTALTAGAVALPAMTAVVFMSLDARDFVMPGVGWVCLLSGLPLAACLVLGVRLQNRGFSAPGLAVSAVMTLAEALIATLLFIPQLLPAHRTANGGALYYLSGQWFGFDVWGPVLLVNALAVLVLVAIIYMRSPRWAAD